jgi:hypothetical protein
MTVFTIDHTVALDDTDYHESQNYPKMNAAVKEKWLEQLRSDTIVQATGNLKKVLEENDYESWDWTEPAPEDVKCGYCCLGVLCEIAIGDAIIEAAVQGHDQDPYSWRTESSEGTTYYDFWRYGGNEDMPPNQVYDWAGVHSEIGGYLASANDQGSSFAEIADWIEKYL